MTATPGSDARTVPERRYLRRFSRTERAVHWIHASAFLVLLGSGLVLYLPALSELVSRRPLVKAVHLWTAVAWIAALALIVLVGDRAGLRRTLRELDRFDADDPPLATRPAGATGPLQRRPEAERRDQRRARLPVRALRIPALVRRARHPLPVCQHDPRPRRPDVRLPRSARRPPLPRRHSPEHPPRSAGLPSAPSTRNGRNDTIRSGRSKPEASADQARDRSRRVQLLLSYLRAGRVGAGSRGGRGGRGGGRSLDDRRSSGRDGVPLGSEGEAALALCLTRLLV